MDNVSRVTASKVRYWDRDLLVVIAQIDANVFLELLSPTQRGVHRVFIQHPAVEQVLLWDLHTDETNRT